MRYGLTSRLELDARISHVYRDDRVSGVAISDNSEILREIDGNGLGDASFGVHYQLNNGKKFPYTILNLRAKAPTGEGPFDVNRDPDSGVDIDIATGSGFWTIEPSVSFILPTAPASIFANIGYQANLATKPNAQVGDSIVREFNAGDAIRASVGVGLSLNDKLSLNFGYDQSRYFETTSLLEVVEDGVSTFARTRRPAATVGSFGIGGSYAVNDDIRINLNTSFGATDEAPDMRVGLRMQIRMF